MAITDPIADMLTRIRNAIMIQHQSVTMPASKMKVGIAQVLKEEGFISDYQVVPAEPSSELEIRLKYGPEGEQVITQITRYSKPGCRRYRSSDQLPKVRGGLGICIVSTNRGVLSDRECREQRVGGEVLCTVE